VIDGRLDDIKNQRK